LVKLENGAVIEGFINVSAVLRCGVYALVREGAVVYVGQGKRMIARVEAHRSNWGRKSVPAWMPVSLRGVLFDDVYVFPCRVEDLDRVERAMIDLYKPKFNIHLKAPTPLTAQPLTLRTGDRGIPINHQPRRGFERRL